VAFERIVEIRGKEKRPTFAHRNRVGRLQQGRVVDGKEIVMGSGEWRYDSAKRTLSVELPRGVLTLKADADKLEGTFTLPDMTILRRIKLKKAECAGSTL
jgi:hypothetical protein